ncbi:Egg CP11, partial [Schistosoma japonicum]
QEPYYTVLRQPRFYQWIRRENTRRISEANVLVPDIGFQVTVNQFVYRSVGVTKNDVTFFLADAAANNNRVRLFRLIGEYSSQKSLYIESSARVFKMSYLDA